MQVPVNCFRRVVRFRDVRAGSMVEEKNRVHPVQPVQAGQAISSLIQDFEVHSVGLGFR